MRDEYYIPDSLNYYGWIPPVSDAQVCGLEIHRETMEESKRSPNKKDPVDPEGWSWNGTSWSKLPASSGLSMSLTPIGTRILSQTGLGLSNSVKMCIVCCRDSKSLRRELICSLKFSITPVGASEIALN